MNPLPSRKKLLLAESELNRAQLAQTWQTMTGEVHGLTNQARTIGSFGSVTASLLAILAFFHRKNSASAVVAGKASGWRTAFKSVGMLFTFWKIFRPSDRRQEDK